MPPSSLSDSAKNVGKSSNKTKNQQSNKRELMELADYLYSRHLAHKKSLNKGSSQTILETELNNGSSKGGSQ